VQCLWKWNCHFAWSVLGLVLFLSEVQGTETLDANREEGCGNSRHLDEECCICKHPMDPHSTAPEETLMAIRCGHVFHKVCILRTWSVGGWPDQWCPMKCHDSLLIRDMEIELDQPMEDGAVAVGSQGSQSQGTGEMVL
jgi:hypothetical protein